MMGLVGYSDSEDSDSASPPPRRTAPPPAATKPAPSVPKVVDSSAPRRIKVDLPAIKPQDGTTDGPPAAKKPRTGGAFGGFNSFLPAPKRTAEVKKPGLGRGVNLKTGAEPAFSRERVEPDPRAFDRSQDESGNPDTDTAAAAAPAPATSSSTPEDIEKPKEVKMVGNAMRFKPLSVAKGKKKAVKKATSGGGGTTPAPSETSTSTPSASTTPAAAPPSKPKVSLFSISSAEDTASTTQQAPKAYEPILAASGQQEQEQEPVYDSSSTYQQSSTYHYPHQDNNTNPLLGVADDLNLSAADRRRLFGRNAAVPTNIMHFDMEQEYARNEELRSKGGPEDQRAVKAVAPGKHSLQQLINNAASQKDKLEEVWAKGKNAR